MGWVKFREGLLPFLFYGLLVEGTVYHHDVVVYGSTPAGIMAAIAAARVGRPNKLSVALLSVTDHIGGMCAGGLGKTDVGQYAEKTIGGLAREFFLRNTAHYNHTSGCCVWNLEPHVATSVFEGMMAEAGITRIRSAGNVLKATKLKSNPTRLESIVTEGGEFMAKVFIDASYEGDLLAMTNVSYCIGRESRETYGESYAGVVGHADGHSFVLPVDPCLDPTCNELLPLMTGKQADARPGEGDGLVQSYNFRLCMSKTHKVEIPKPLNYRPERWELFRRYIHSLVETNLTEKVLRFPSANTAQIPNHKYDCNNAGAISTDFVGGSWTYPTATNAERKSIWEAHRQYTLELFWFLRTDPVIPAEFRNSAREWGLCADEFVYTDHWPPQLYVREARRMVGDSVFTQVDIEFPSHHDDDDLTSIGLGSYNYDNHNVQRIARTFSTNKQWFYAWNEGDLEINPGIYEIPVSVLLPKRAEATNLLSPVSVSASHVAFNTLRMEPQFMIMGQAAGTIAALVLRSTREETAVQDVDLKLLRSRLLMDGQFVLRQHVDASASS